MNLEKTCFKISYQDEVRRLSLPTNTPTFSQFCNLIESVFSKSNATQQLLIQYEDEEHDKVVVNSEVEFQEALLIMQNAPVKKFYLSNIPKKKLQKRSTPTTAKKQQPSPSTSTTTKQPEEEEVKTVPKTTTTTTTTETINDSATTATSTATTTPSETIKTSNSNEGFLSMKTMENFVESISRDLPPLIETVYTQTSAAIQDNVKHLKSYIDSATLPKTPSVTAKTTPPPTKKPTTEISVPLGLELMKQTKYDQARVVFQALIEKNPSDVLAIYNLACLESIVGNPIEAIQLLNLANELGYANADYIDQDTDFNNIRHLPEFEALVNAMRHPARTNNTQTQPCSSPQTESTPTPTVIETSTPTTTATVIETPVTIPIVEAEKIETPPTPTPTPTQTPAHSTPVLTGELDPFPYQKELDILINMGFTKQELLKSLLVEFEGDLDRTIDESLLQSDLVLL